MSPSFRVEGGPDGPVCNGPFGPMTIHNRVGGTTVDTPAGRAYLDWDMSS